MVFLPWRIIWAGTRINALTNVLNSIRITASFSALCLLAHRPFSVSTSPNHALRLQARDAITI